MSTATAPQSQQNSMEQKLVAAIDRGTISTIGASQTRGMAITSLAQAMEFAKLMSLAREAVPKHLRESPGACLAIAIQAYEWSINPFALANKSYVVNDRLCFEASLYQSVVARRAPIVGRIKMEYTGEAQQRKCRVWAVLADGTGDVEYTSPLFANINPKNSPLWKNDPDQQLFYFSVRAFARRHFPDVMMGIYTVDEMMDNPETVRTVENVADTRSKTERLTDRLTAPRTAAVQETDDRSISDVGDRLADAVTLPETDQTQPVETHPQSWFAACEDVLREAGLTLVELDGADAEHPTGKVWLLPNGTPLRLSNNEPDAYRLTWLKKRQAYDVRTTDADAVQQTRDILARCQQKGT